MIKFKITPTRVAEAATMIEFIGGLSGNLGSIMLLLPKLIIGEDGEYIVKVTLDEDGDIAAVENFKEAERMIQGSVNARRMDTLRKEVQTALQQIVNPPKSGG